MPGALAGIRVLESTQHLAGPSTFRLDTPAQPTPQGV